MLVHEKQSDSNWCWIACYRMACSYFAKPADEQCAIAQKILKKANCCPPKSNPECNASLAEAGIPSLYASVGLSASVVPVSDRAFQRALTPTSLLLAMLAFPNTYHFVLATAYDVANSKYTIHDPAYGAVVPPVDYATFGSAYGQGSIATAWRLAVAKALGAKPAPPVASGANA